MVLCETTTHSLTVHVASLAIEVRLSTSHSLKEKRALLRPVLEGCRRRFSVAVAEVGHQDAWQRATLGVATVSGTVSQASKVLDSVERFVWSFPELEIIGCERRWLDTESAGDLSWSE